MKKSIGGRPRLYLNAFAEVVPVVRNKRVYLHVRAPRRGRSMRNSLVRETSRTQLAASNLYLPKRSMPRAVRFEPGLDLKALAQWRLGASDPCLRAAAGGYRLNPAFKSLGGQWQLRDPLTGLVYTLTPGRRGLALAKRKFKNLTGIESRALILARVLVPRDYERVRRAWLRELAARGRELRARGAVSLGALLPPPLSLELGRYFQRLKAEGFCDYHPKPDNKFVVYNDANARALMKDLTPLLSKILRTKLRPTYPYYYSYGESAMLRRHRDREQCQYSVAIQLDYEPSAAPVRARWPLKIIGADGVRREWTQECGEGLLFLGRDLEHWRARAPAGHKLSAVLFHYVDHDSAVKRLIPDDAKRTWWGRA
ncbi:MAG TPA: hypothetical protein VFV50_06475 [Bdellovibrionales bacterium]|nr:hypothetical protein [Bdellovibrionales bacterium]